MDSSKLDENPREKASVISVLSFYWTFGLFRKGYLKVLQLNDLIRPLNADRSERLGDLLQRQVLVNSVNAHINSNIHIQLLSINFIIMIHEG